MRAGSSSDAEMEVICQPCGGSSAGLIPGLDLWSDVAFGGGPRTGGVTHLFPAKLGISATVDDVSYTAAATCGDGACGLHSLWGLPTKEAGSLLCSDAREKLLEVLPALVADVERLHNGTLRAPLEALLQSVWIDMARPAAAAMLLDAPVAVEHAMLWRHLDAELQEELLEFEKLRRFERENE